MKLWWCGSSFALNTYNLRAELARACILLHLNVVYMTVNLNHEPLKLDICPAKLRTAEYYLSETVEKTVAMI